VLVDPRGVEADPRRAGSRGFGGDKGARAGSVPDAPAAAVVRIRDAGRSGAKSGTMVGVASIDKIEKQARNSPANVSYSDMLKLCTHYFGEPRSGSGSHNAIFKMPWAGDPRINLQNKMARSSPTR
jgi:hypothetical protein